MDEPASICCERESFIRRPSTKDAEEPIIKTKEHKNYNQIIHLKQCQDFEIHRLKNMYHLLAWRETENPLFDALRERAKSQQLELEEVITGPELPSAGGWSGRDGKLTKSKCLSHPIFEKASIDPTLNDPLPFLSAAGDQDLNKR